MEWWWKNFLVTFGSTVAGMVMACFVTGLAWKTSYFTELFHLSCVFFLVFLFGGAAADTLILRLVNGPANNQFRTWAPVRTYGGRSLVTRVRRQPRRRPTLCAPLRRLVSTAHLSAELPVALSEEASEAVDVFVSNIIRDLGKAASARVLVSERKLVQEKHVAGAFGDVLGPLLGPATVDFIVSQLTGLSSAKEVKKKANQSRGGEAERGVSTRAVPPLGHRGNKGKRAVHREDDDEQEGDEGEEQGHHHGNDGDDDDDDDGDDVHDGDDDDEAIVDEDGGFHYQNQGRYSNARQTRAVEKKLCVLPVARVMRLVKESLSGGVRVGRSSVVLLTIGVQFVVVRVAQRALNFVPPPRSPISPPMSSSSSSSSSSLSWNKKQNKTSNKAAGRGNADERHVPLPLQRHTITARALELAAADPPIAFYLSHHMPVVPHLVSPNILARVGVSPTVVDALVCSSVTSLITTAISLVEPPTHTLTLDTVRKALALLVSRPAANAGPCEVWPLCRWRDGAASGRAALRGVKGHTMVLPSLTLSDLEARLVALAHAQWAVTPVIKLSCRMAFTQSTTTSRSSSTRSRGSWNSGGGSSNRVNEVNASSLHHSPPRGRLVVQADALRYLCSVALCRVYQDLGLDNEDTTTEYFEPVTEAPSSSFGAVNNGEDDGVLAVASAPPRGAFYAEFPGAGLTASASPAGPLHSPSSPSPSNANKKAPTKSGGWSGGGAEGEGSELAGRPSAPPREAFYAEFPAGGVLTASASPAGSPRSSSSSSPSNANKKVPTKSGDGEGSGLPGRPSAPPRETLYTNFSEVAPGSSILY